MITPAKNPMKGSLKMENENNGIFDENITAAQEAKDNLSAKPEPTADEVTEKADASAEDGAEKKKKKPLDILPKILCVFFAVILWFYVMQVDRTDYEETFDSVEIVLTNTALLEERNLSVISGKGYTVNVTLSGKKSTINKYSTDDIKVTADLKNITEAGEYKVPLSIGTLPSGITFEEFDYNEVTVYVDEKTSESISLEAKVSGAIFGQEYEYGQLEAEVDSVMVSGPKKVIESIDHAVASVDFSSLGIISETTSSVSPITLLDKDGNEVSTAYLTLKPSEMKVTLPVFTQKTVPLTLSYAYGYYNDKNVEVKIEPASAVIKGDPSVLKGIETLNVTKLDEKQINGDTKNEYTLTDGDGYSVVGDKKVTVSVKHVGTVTKTYTIDRFTVVSGDNKYEVVDKTLDVTLRGSSVALGNITAADITVKADISEYTKDNTGTFGVPCEISVKSDYSDGVYEIGTYSLQVKVN